MPGHQIVGNRAGDAVHGGDEGGPIGLGPADARLPHGRLAAADDPRQLRPHANQAHLVQHHRQHGAGGIFVQPRPQVGRHAVVLALLLQEAQGGQGVQQDGRRPQVRAEPDGDGLGGQGLVAQEREEVQFGGRPEHGQKAETAGQLQDLFAIELMGGCHGLPLGGVRSRAGHGRST